MRKLFYCIIILMLNANINSFSQCTHCEPDKSTDPKVNNINKFSHKRNYFDWTKINFEAYVSGSFVQITSPFYQVANIQTNKFSSMSNKDYLPEAGWELIAEDFGYIYSNTEDLKYPRTATNGVVNPYFVLYNKYTGLLRLFWTTSSRLATFPKYSIILNYSKFTNDYKIGNNIVNRTIESTIKPLNKFDKDNSGKAISPEIANVGTFPNIGVLTDMQWFYAEFHIDYDPCNCVYKYRFMFDLSLLNLAKIEFESDTKGSVQYDETLVDYDKNGNANSMATNSSDKSFDINDIVNGGKKVASSYTNGGSLKEQLDKIIDDNTYIDPSKITDLKEQTRLIEEYTKHPKTRMDQNTSADLKQATSFIPYISAAIDLVNLLTMSSKSNEPKPVVLAPMAIKLSTKNNGTISTYNNVSNIIFDLPGSNEGNFDVNLPTYIPYYNYPLGISALLTTPKINYFTEVNGYCSVFAKVDKSTLQYSINPLVFDINESKVYVSVETEYTYDDNIPFDNAPTSRGTVINPFAIHLSPKKIITEFVPIECIDNLLMKYRTYGQDNWSQVTLTSYHYSMKTAVKDFYLNVLYVLKPKDASRNNIVMHNVKYRMEKEWKQYHTGTTNFFYSETSSWDSYTDKIKSIGWDQRVSAPENSINPWDRLNLEGTSFEILASQYLGKGVLKAGKSINIKPLVVWWLDGASYLSAESGASLNLRIESPAENCNRNYTTGLKTDLSSFCSNNNSDSYNPTSRMIQSKPDEQTKDSVVVPKAKVFPNPATNKLNLSLNGLLKKNLEIKVYDVVGADRAILLNKTKQEIDSYVYKFDISMLENGTYFVEINIDEQIERIPIVVLR